MSLQGWLFLTRFGEMQMLLPAALAAILILFQKQATRPLALGWLISLAMATLVTTASKVAFIGWGIGVPEIDFTGVSGHTMLATAVYPLLFSLLASQLAPQYQKVAVAVGFLLALLVGQSRLAIDVHSVSEVLAGVLLGGAVSLSMLVKNALPRGTAGLASWYMVVVFCGFFMASLLNTPQVNPHSWVIQLSLKLSGSATPNTREKVKKSQLSPP